MPENKIIGYTIRFPAPDKSFCACFYDKEEDALRCCMDSEGRNPGTVMEIVTLYEGPVTKRFVVTGEPMTVTVQKVRAVEVEEVSDASEQSASGVV
jgi:hypothetical protein